jgi:hypothetical protein
MHRFLVNVRLAKNKIKAYWGSPYGNTINDNIRMGHTTINDNIRMGHTTINDNIRMGKTFTIKPIGHEPTFPTKVFSLR